MATSSFKCGTGCWVFVIAILHSVCSQNIRLEGGGQSSEGRVEIYYNYQWSTICDDFWDEKETLVVCSQLGYSTTGQWQGNAYYGEGTGSIFNVDCSGTETRLEDCFKYTTSSCSHSEDVGVDCGMHQNGDIRLMGSSLRPNAGRVEIFYDGEWGTVCDDEWGNADARVVCRQLGYSTTDAVSYGSAYYGRGTGSILLDGVSCSGYESRLDECNHYNWGFTNCNHYDDAGVDCDPNGFDTTTSYNGNIAKLPFDSIRLVDGSSPDEGRVEVLANGQWGTICDDFWSTSNARVVCRELDYPSTDAQALSNAYFGEGSGPVWLDGVQCTGDEYRLESCSYSSGFSYSYESSYDYYSCSHSQDVGVRCMPTASTDSKVIGMMSFVGISLFLLIFVGVIAVFRSKSTVPPAQTTTARVVSVSSIIDMPNRNNLATTARCDQPLATTNPETIQQPAPITFPDLSPALAAPPPPPPYTQYEAGDAAPCNASEPSELFLL